MKLYALVFLFSITQIASAQVPLKKIDKSTLEYYLSRSVNIQGLNDFCKTSNGIFPGTSDKIVHDAELISNSPEGSANYITEQDRKSGKLFERYRDMLRLIQNVKPKLITDAVTHWGSWDWNIHLQRCSHTVQDIKNIDPEIIVQASLNEFADQPTANGIGPIPDWVFQAFGIPFQDRLFSIKDMTFSDWKTNNKHWWNYGSIVEGLPTAIVPDISRLETRMWFYYQGRVFIDMGCESIQFSQVELMNNGSDDPLHWNEVFQRLRQYADAKNDIRFLLITGHTNGMKDLSDHLAFDFHSSPVRPSELGPNTSINGGSCNITSTSCNWGGNPGKLYDRSKGGITPSGWYCTDLPGIVFLDNYGNEGEASHWGSAHGTGNCSQYHFDEITWYALQDKDYRDNWLKYAWYIVQQLDANIHFSLPVKRRTTFRESWYPADYLANDPNASFLPTPATIGNIKNGLVDRSAVEIYAGYGQENTIKEILSMENVPPAEIKIYPNPAGSEINIYISTKLGLSKLRYNITNMLGLKIASDQVVNDRNNIISTELLSDGIYIINIFDEYNGIMLSDKIVVSRH